ncbi:MAG: phosphoglucosamine mutase [Opitutaceae bacterium]
MGKYFGTDGIRGAFGCDHMNPEFAYRVGAALAKHRLKQAANTPLNIVIGRDTRQSGKVLSDALTQGLNAQGALVHDVGVVPTPAVAKAIIAGRADMGIVITASHNPAKDNGIKLFNAQGQKLDDAEELQIEALIETELAPVESLPQPQAEPLDGASLYINDLQALMDEKCLEGWKIVLDTAHGATHVTSPAVFKRWGADLHLMGNSPDGKNINLGVGSECPDLLGAAVREHNANIGIAHDGDGDRLVVCDENGDVVDGDVLLGIIGIYALQSGSLKQNTLVSTIQSNLGLDAAIRKAGGNVVRVDIGDRNVAQKMREIGSNIGGENSGHIIFSDAATTGDGLLAAIKVIETMCHLKKPLSELAKQVHLFPQKTKNLMVAVKTPLADLKTLQSAIKSVETDFGEEGRVLVRYSGTEPKLRLLVEGKLESDVESALTDIENAARVDLDVIDG